MDEGGNDTHGKCSQKLLVVQSERGPLNCGNQSEESDAFDEGAVWVIFWTENVVRSNLFAWIIFKSIGRSAFILTHNLLNLEDWTD
jgi:hypothetical protein